MRRIVPNKSRHRWHVRTRAAVLLLFGAGAIVATTNQASTEDGAPGDLEPRTAPLAWDDIAINVDSGLVTADNAVAGEQIVYSEVIDAGQAVWTRLEFGEVQFSGSLLDGTNAYLRITSLQDGAVQTLNARSIRQWRYTSAYFNGQALLVELIAHGQAGPSRVEVTGIQAGKTPEEDMLASICDDSDDRELSGAPPNEPDGRILPVGCTGFLISDQCFLTAGHCTTESNGCCNKFDPDRMQIVEFDVPLSLPNGDIVMSHPDNQYPVHTESIQFQDAGCGDDWAYFGVFENSNTGLTPIEAQGTMYTLADEDPAPIGANLRVRGYGTTTDTELPNEWNQVLMWDSGPYWAQSGTLLRHRVDTEPGNSGSAVYWFATNEVIGVHTCGSCDDDPESSNRGTVIHHPNLQNALNSPVGICAIDVQCPGSGSCCASNGSPGCNNAECCELICDADPFCCNTEWDSLCASAAMNQCPVCYDCGHPDSGDCCSANDTQACDDESCCELICANDQFCCNNTWDSLCASAANDECFDACFECGHGPAGNCCEPNNTPYCDDASCCASICNDDPFCCDSSWDSLCADAANQQCAICLECGDAFAGDCCESGNTPYCEDEACCELICENDAFCCNNTWDGICASAANQQCVDACFECGHEPAGNCCEANDTPYCQDEACCQFVCDSDPFCCNTSWDGICASAANDECIDACFECGHAPAGDCCETSSTPYCDNAECCDTVCDIDSFCCNTMWDSICVSLAEDTPACDCETDEPVDSCPWDLNDDGVVDVLDLLILLENWGPANGHPADFNDDDVIDVLDLLILLENWGSCPEAACDNPFNCDDGDTEWCDDSKTCACVADYEGVNHCMLPWDCPGTSCPDGQCPDGYVCMVDTCCGDAECFPVEAVCGGPVPLQDRETTRDRTQTDSPTLQPARSTTGNAFGLAAPE